MTGYPSENAELAAPTAAMNPETILAEIRAELATLREQVEVLAFDVSVLTDKMRGASSTADAPAPPIPPPPGSWRGPRSGHALEQP